MPMSDHSASLLQRLFPGRGDLSLPLWEAYRIWLRALADRKQAEAAAAGLRFDEQILPLVNSNGDRRTWERLYEAEQRLVPYLNEEEVQAEFRRRIEEARRLEVKSADALEAGFRETASVEGRRMLYLALLDDVHFRYIKRTLDRKTRRAAGVFLNALGLVMLSLVLAMSVALGFDSGRQVLVDHHVVLVVVLGAVGAFLSRMINFQGRMEQIDYDAVKNGYSAWTVTIRLIVGSFSATIFYFLVAANLVSGELFPGGVGAPSGAGKELLFGAEDFAKLVVWSILAGFSERLVPEHLTRLEGSVEVPGGPGSAPSPGAGPRG